MTTTTTQKHSELCQYLRQGAGLPGYIMHPCERKSKIQVGRKWYCTQHAKMIGWKPSDAELAR